MAITVTLSHKQVSGEISLPNYEESYTRVYTVVADTLAEIDEPTAMNETIAQTGITLGSFHPSSPFAILTKVRAQIASEDGCTWEVHFQFGRLDQQQVDNPLAEPAKLSGGFATHKFTPFRDIMGRALVNSAGQPFASVPEVDEDRGVLRITKNYSFLPPVGLWKGKINADYFLGYRPGTVRIADVPFEQIHHNIIGTYYQVGIEFHIKADGWRVKILDAGMNYKDGNQIKAILVGGKPTSEPRELDGNGRANPPNSQPVFRTFEFYYSIPFSALGLL